MRKQKKTQLTNIELGPDYTVEVKPGGVRPLACAVTLRVPTSYGDTNATVILNRRRLECVITEIQDHALAQLAETTRDDDALIGGRDVIEPEPTVESILDEFPGVVGDRLRAALAKQKNTEGSAE